MTKEAQALEMLEQSDCPFMLKIKHSYWRSSEFNTEIWIEETHERSEGKGPVKTTVVDCCFSAFGVHRVRRHQTKAKVEV